ncbi:hypothetical protein CPB83DRAFT_770221 [Crepidotus variabilis]|uniref:Uncharacterized protein n=1 Tax=Crepidotus variabilis TaxID=179855 RepID=A0A9P6ECQ6_9AGAR|nr:hypothetical protein CPB83DRAFT_770221 [Crepidotus variabilis]
MAFTFLYLSFVAALVSAANDWSQPCFNGECEYDLPSTPRGPSGTLKIWGPRHLISDITPAAGWAIIDCDPNLLKQNVRLVCEEGSADHCGRLSGGLETVGDASVGRIVRLPEECGGNAFGVVTNAWVPEDQTIPAHFVSRLTRRDGTLPTVQALSLGVNFSAVPAPADPNDHVRFAIQGANIEGAAGNMTRPPLPEVNGLQGRGFREWLDNIINGLKHLNEWNIDNQKQLSAIDVDQSFNVFDRSITCPPLKIGIRMDVNTKAHAVVSVGVVAMGTFLPPKIDDMALVSTFNANLDGELDLKASIGGEVSTGQISLYEVGIPGLNFPGILSVGPKFEVNAEATANLELAVDMKVGIHYQIDKASFTFPPKAGHTGSFNQGDTLLTLAAIPSTSVTGAISAHIIPRVVFGISALKDSVKADIFVDLDASASMTLKLVASAPQEIPVPLHARRSIESSPPELGGCFDIDVGFDVNAGAEGSFFNIFDASTSFDLYTKHWSPYKVCI